MYELIAAVITGVATLVAALLATQDGRQIMKEVVGMSKSEGAEGARALPAPSPARNVLMRFVFIFVVGAVTGGIFFHMAANAAEKISFTGGYKMPVGTITAYMGKVAPDGWLLCNGKDIPTQYKELVNLIGEKTPDMQGRFLRGLDPTGTIDVDGGKNRALGSPQEDAFKEHSHTVNGVLIPDIGDHHYDGGPTRVTTGTASAGESNPKGGSETRPKNVAVNFIIKY